MNIRSGSIPRGRPAHEWAGYYYEGHLRGLIQPAQAGFVMAAEGFSPAGDGDCVSPVNITTSGEQKH